jgi:hypothetical protein
MTFNARDEPPKDKQTINIQYDLERKDIELWGYSIPSKPETWNSSGKIVSMLDLPGTQLIVQLEYDEVADRCR